MSHLISKITFKVFMLFLGVMIALSGYFLTVSHFETLKNLKVMETKRAKSLVDLFAITAQEKLNSEGREKEYDTVRNEIYTLLGKAEIRENTPEALFIIISNTDKGEAEIISSKGSFVISTRQKLDQPYQFLKKSVESDTAEKFDRISSFKSMTLPLKENYRGYVYAELDIQPGISNAQKSLLENSGFALLVFLLIGWLGKRGLKRIFHHEVLAKKKLREYASIAEKKAQELERLSFVLKRSENLVLLTDAEGRIEWLNESAQRKNNYTEEELKCFIGRELAEVSHYPKIKEVIKKVTETGEKETYEAKSYDALGKEFWASTTVTPILDENGDVINILFIDADITKLKQAEQDIEKLANFPQENTRPVMRFSKDAEILYANKPGLEIIESWGLKLNDKVTRSSICGALSKAVETSSEVKVNLEFENRIFSLRFYPIENQNYVNAYGEDITEIKTAEQEYKAKTLLLEQHNLNITDSMNYARRIQESIIPGEDQFRQYFKDSFVLSQPKDIVSGDFIWIKETIPQEEYIFALADCTGHGVPGAMMSIIGHSLLNEIVESEKITDPACILERLNCEVIKTLRQKHGGKSSDGMDVSVVKINRKELKVTFAGAFQPLYWMNGKLNVVKGDRQPIGGIHHNMNRRFTNQSFSISKGDCLFLATDGYTDQFGGPENKKFLSRRLRELFAKNHKYSMQAQSFIYKKTFEEWKGEGEQIDDVSMVGVKI